MKHFSDCKVNGYDTSDGIKIGECDCEGYEINKYDIETMITNRLIMFHERLIEAGQIQPIHPGTILGDGVVCDPNDFKKMKPDLKIVSSDHATQKPQGGDK